MEENSDNPQKKKGKLLTSLIIGGAIGSVLGLALAPKKTREVIQKNTSKALKTGKNIGKSLAQKAIKRIIKK